MLRPVAEPPRTFTGAQGSPAGRTPWRGLTSPRPSSIVGFATVVAHTAQRCPDDTSSSVGRHSCLLAGLVSGAGDCRKKPIQRTARGFQMQFRTPLLFASGGFFRQAVPALPDVVFSGGPAGTPFPCFPSHHRCPRPSRARLGGWNSARVIDGQLMELVGAVSPRPPLALAAGVHRSNVSLGSRPSGKGGAAWEP